MAPKYVTRGNGMTERLLKVPETPAESIAAFDALNIPFAQSGDWLGDALMRATAERNRSVLSHVGLEDAGACVADRRALESVGLAEGSAAWIAAHWLAEYHSFLRCRERIESGDAGVRNLTTMMWAMHEMGRLQEEMRWRPGVDPQTGKAREQLALSGRRQVKGGHDGNAMRGQKSFASLYGEQAQLRACAIAADRPDLSWTAIRLILARKYAVSAETIKKALRNPKEGG